jgi:hypothetical protein
MSFESKECRGEVLNTSRNTPFTVLNITISNSCLYFVLPGTSKGMYVQLN